MNYPVRGLKTENELDINAALLQKFQTIDQAVLTKRAIDYLTSVGATDKIARLAAIETGYSEFYQDHYGLLITDFSYGEVKQSLKSVIAHQETYANASPDDPLEATFSYEYSRQDGQSFKFTEGLKVGTKAGVKAKLPLVGEANVEVERRGELFGRAELLDDGNVQMEFSSEGYGKAEHVGEGCRLHSDRQG